MEEGPSVSEIVCRLDSSGTNFLIWKRKLDFVFIDNRVKYVLTVPKPPTAGDSDTEKVGYDKWVADDFTARHIILGAISDDLYLQFHYHSTAKAMMDDLTARFASPSMSRRMMLLKGYVGHRMSEDTPVLNHILKMGSLAIDLKLDGVPIPDELQAVMLMNSLPESWNDSISGLLVQMDQEELSLQNVTDRVRIAGESMAFVKQHREEDYKKKQMGYKYQIICYCCGKPGHHGHECKYVEPDF